MPKRTPVILGAVLMLSALLLFLYNDGESDRAGEESRQILEVLHTATAPTTQATEETLAAVLPTMTVEDTAYIGYLVIADLKLELPVMARWDYEKLKTAPCRQAGSARTDDLVIAAHNYKTHFGSLSKLSPGAELLFTDVEGMEIRYTLKKLETVEPDAGEKVLDSGYDLVLYTCTPGGAARIVAFFDRG